MPWLGGRALVVGLLPSRPMVLIDFARRLWCILTKRLLALNMMFAHSSLRQHEILYTVTSVTQ